MKNQPDERSDETTFHVERRRVSFVGGMLDGLLVVLTPDTDSAGVFEMHSLGAYRQNPAEPNRWDFEPS